MEAYNAEIGYEIGAFFPQVTLSASYGYSGNPLQQLIQTATRTWSLGAAATETIFEGGSRSAAVRSAEADYDNAVATYRQTVLAALQDTEDQMSGLHYLDQQLALQNAAVKSAEAAVQVSMNEYLAGTQIYTTVITAEQNALQYQETQLSVRQQQFLAEVKLITDLGGGWTTQQLPSKTRSRRTIRCFRPSSRGQERKLKHRKRAGPLAPALSYPPRLPESESVQPRDTCENGQHCQHQEDDEEQLGDPSRCGRNTGKAENTGNDGNDKENNRIVQHDAGSSPKSSWSCRNVTSLRKFNFSEKDLFPTKSR